MRLGRPGGESQVSLGGVGRGDGWAEAEWAQGHLASLGVLHSHILNMQQRRCEQRRGFLLSKRGIGPGGSCERLSGGQLLLCRGAL